MIQCFIWGEYEMKKAKLSDFEFSYNVPTDDKYEIIVTYSNLYGKKYQQRYPFDKEFIILQSERITLPKE